MPIRVGSQILIHGYGSSGKAGFGLKILLSPSIPGKIENVTSSIITAKASRNKVLVVSFLYPEDYYDKLLKTILKQNQILYENYDKKSTDCIVKAFYPGYLTPEDFVYKIVRLLDEAVLEGDPFTGIMLDGLHNVFLQFKNLQGAHMIWPLLYSILSRYNLSVVTTFTNFSVSVRILGSKENQSNQRIDDSVLFQEGQKPFLHGLVKAADYYFILDEIIDEKDFYKKKYLLSVKSSPDDPPLDLLQWNRQKLIFENIFPAKSLYEMQNY